MNVSILGCGVFGMALANSFLDNSSVKLKMWSKFQKEVDELGSKYPDISFSTDLEYVTTNSDLVVIAIPVSFLEDTVKEFKDIYQGQDILVASKGIDTKTHRFAYEIILDYLDKANIGVISGGSFAQDMMDKKVMGLTLATDCESIRLKIRNSLENNFLRIQYIDDIIGCSVCGAIKNVMAIGFGIMDGAHYPESSRFLFLTEAIYEIRMLIEYLGGKSDTIMSYAGIDDIMMTCTSSKSRNYTLGKLLGENSSLDKIEEYKNSTTIEGLGTCKAVYELSQEKGISLPITSIIYKILYENNAYQELVEYLEKES